MMSITNSRSISFTDLPDEARLWIFASPTAITGAPAVRLLELVDGFLEGWHAHGHPVVGGRDWRYDRFLLVAADEAATGVSGCSTDALFKIFKGAEKELGITLLDGSLVWYREGEEIRSAGRGDFRERARAGGVTGDTFVFDNTVPTVGDVRAGRWERAAREAWHGRAFGLG